MTPSEQQRFAVVKHWVVEHGFDPVRVKQSLVEGSIPGVKIGARWMVDTWRANERFDFDRKPAA